MNAIETILSRKSIPLMEDPKPSKSQLKKIYKAGLRAPDHGGLNPWKFIEVSGDDRLKLGKKFVNVTKKVKRNPSKELLIKVKKAPKCDIYSAAPCFSGDCGMCANCCRVYDPSKLQEYDRRYKDMTKIMGKNLIEEYFLEIDCNACMAL